MNAPDVCIICLAMPSEQTLNGLAMLSCPSCHLIWRKSFDLPSDYYQDKIMHGEQDAKSQRRANVFDRIRTFTRHANLDHLCDIGAGDGLFLWALRERGYSDAVGIEPSESGRRNAMKLGLRVYAGTVADTAKLFSQNHISTASLCHVLEHLQDPLGALRDIQKSLPPGGQLILETPNIDGYTLIRSSYLHKLVYPEHLFYFNESNLKELVSMSGFRVIASGKRDFDQWNLSMKEILIRLGLRGSTNTRRVDRAVASARVQTGRGHSSTLLRYPKKLVRRALSSIVVGLRRLDYMWLVAEKI